MRLFSGMQYEELTLPFILDTYSMAEEDRKAGIISIELYGTVMGEMRYGYASFVLTDRTLYDNGGYEEMLEALQESEGKLVGVRFKHKNGKLKGFEVLLDTLRDLYGDDRFLKMECIGWGINEKSCRELKIADRI
ncbi:MAG: hypothetical protein KH452_11180 [Clostridiales bacterium]|nr:hypothetical protein [Clostridiales bacterium]